MSGVRDPVIRDKEVLYKGVFFWIDDDVASYFENRLRYMEYCSSPVSCSSRKNQSHQNLVRKQACCLQGINWGKAWMPEHRELDALNRTKKVAVVVVGVGYIIVLITLIAGGDALV